MQYREYGKTGLKVSLLGMGCMRLPRRTLGDGTVEIDREKAVELIRYAVDHGVNYVDTALTYHAGKGEAMVGEALDDGYRKRVCLVTKQPFAAMKNSKDTMRRNLEETLKKLRTDHLDVYLVHNIQPHLWEGIKKLDVLSEYEKFKSEGLIRHIAFSYHGPYATFAEILAAYDWEMCQIQQNLIDTDRQATEQGIIDAGKKGCALAIMEPLRGGGLVNPPADVKALYDAFPTKRTPVEWAFRHLYNYPQISTILSGMTTLEQLKANIALFSGEDVLPNVMNAEEKALLRSVKAAYDARVTIPCTGCEYCLPCPNGVAIPSIFAQYNEGRMLDGFDNPRRNYMFNRRAQTDATHCVSCGMCETKCPQRIAIRSELKVAHEALKGWDE